jgi:DUF4097 and DUF4098 domain-containing protein YvlB
VDEHTLETTMTDHRFHTPGPLSLYVENGSGTVTIEATETEESTVSITGRDADDVRVTEENGHLSVVAPHRRAGFFTGDSSLHMRLVVPTGSEMMVRTGSADVTVDGTVGAAQVKSGSGEVRMGQLAAPAQIETGSGDVRVETAHAELRVKSGSGDVTVTRAESAVAVSTGSGDVRLGTTSGPAVVKTGSGDFRVVDAGDDVSLATGSGDLLVETARRGRFTVKGASGDVQIGIPAGIPVWTDINTLTGQIRSDLVGAGEPEPGADHIEVRAKTVSGDVVLTQL